MLAIRRTHLSVLPMQGLNEEPTLQSKEKTTVTPNRAATLWMVHVPRVLLIVVLLVGAGGIAKLMVATKATSEMNPPATAAVVVRTIESIHRPASRIWSGYGTVKTMGSADIVAEVSGRVISRSQEIESGAQVKAGDKLVGIDDSDYINALDAARQSVKSLESQIDGLRVESEQKQLQVQYASEEIEAAKRDLDRIQQAIDAGAGSDGERDVKLAAMLRSQRELSVLQQQLDLIPSRRAGLEAQLSLQHANERIAMKNVERSQIRAPFSGELQSIDAREGDWVTMGARVARLVDLSRLEIPLKVPATASTWIKSDDEVRIWIGDPNGQPDQVGKIVRIAPEADAGSRTITVFVEVKQDPSDPNRILPGQFVHGRVVSHDPHDRVILPRRAVQANRVYVVDQSVDGAQSIKVMPVKVAYSFESFMRELDPIETQWVAMEIGYEPVEGSLVVVSLLDQMTAGMRVQIESEQSDSGSDIEGDLP